ncbi:MAG: GrpB family protein [Patescibacteria group bacterium]|nr:GrpB family protein [Patescibacteria group bacterium]
MKNLPPFPRGYFQKFSTKPVILKPYDPKSKQISDKIINNLQEILKNYSVKIIHRGSTAFGIAGKGDIEIGVYPSADDWKATVEAVRVHFGNPQNVESDYVRFNTRSGGFEVEIILQNGDSAKVDLALTNYLKTHPQALKEYGNIKKKFAYSKREYQIQKDKFLRAVVRSLPEPEQRTVLKNT